MPIHYLLLISRQGKLRLAKWFIPLSSKAKAKIVQDLTQLTLSRQQRSSNFLEYKGEKVVYRRYASLFFICQIGNQDNELLTLEIIHRYVEDFQFSTSLCDLRRTHYRWRNAGNIEFLSPKHDQRLESLGGSRTDIQCNEGCSHALAPAIECQVKPCFHTKKYTRHRRVNWYDGDYQDCT